MHFYCEKVYLWPDVGWDGYPAPQINFIWNFQIKKCRILCIFVPKKMYLWPDFGVGWGTDLPRENLCGIFKLKMQGFMHFYFVKIYLWIETRWVAYSTPWAGSEDIKCMRVENLVGVLTHQPPVNLQAVYE